MSVLLLGGAGYIGTELSNRFLHDSFEVNVIDLLINENYDSVKKKSKYYTFINDDIINLEKYFNTETDYEYIIYLASPRLNDLKDEKVIDEELDRLDSVLNTIKKYENHSTRFLFLSSCSVYGFTDKKVDETSETMVTSLYSKLKLKCEERVLQENEKYNILRLSTVYGKSDCFRDDNLINSLVEDAKKGNRIEIYDPEAIRPHIHIKDVVEMIRHIISSGPKHRIINIGSDDLNISKRELISLINEITSNDTLEIDFVDRKDNRSYEVSFQLLKDNYLEGIGYNHEFIPYKKAIYELYVDGLNFSHEEWDSIFDYWRPNGSSKTWYLEEEGKLSIPKMWGDWNLIHYQTKKMFDKKFLKDTIFPSFNRKYINFLSESEIGNKNHIYLITIYAPSFFEDNKDIGFDCISKKYIRDVREGRCKLVLFHSMEGYSGSTGNRDLEILKSWINKAKIPETSVYYIHGNLKVDEIAKKRGYKFKCIGISTFDIWLNPNEVPATNVQFIPENDKFLYLSYNRNQRDHRVYLQCELLDSNILNKGRISCGTIPEDKEYLKEIHPSFHKLEPLLPITIDRTLDVNWANDIELSDYEKTFVSLVTETLTDKNILFFSEKIFKPIYVGHPFIVVGNPNTLKKLKEMGYKTFDNWWDESYDSEPNLELRIKKIVSVLNELSKKSIEELNQIRNEMEEIVQHNQHTYRDNTASKYRLENNLYISETPVLKLMADINYGKL